MRVTELLLGIGVPGVSALPPYNAWSVADLGGCLTGTCSGDYSRIFVTGSAVVKALIEAIPILVKLEVELRFLDLGTCMGKPPLTTKSVFLSSSVRHPNKEPVSASWTSSGRTITLQTPQMLPWALRRMTTICTISSLRFLLASLQLDQLRYFSSQLWGRLLSNYFH